MPPLTKKNIQNQARNMADNSNLFCYQEKVAIASIEAGYTLLPAIPNQQYRIFDMAMLAVGGTASGATDVRLLGTQGGSAKALMIAAVASLVRHVKFIASTAASLGSDDGAGFATPLDVNTSVTVGKTGGTLATATHVVFFVSYALIPTRTGA